jgi:mannose-6-phosphate isomerase-like protein (cupin superfamily)
MGMERLRRVVSGIDKDGLSRFVADEIVEAIVPPTLGTTLIQLFGNDKPLVVPNDGSQESGLNFFPKAPGATRFFIFTYRGKNDPPHPDYDPNAHEATEKLTPGMGEIISDANGMHATTTVDLEYVLSGAPTIILDSGERKVLRAGDSLIQCGTKHSWVNEGDEPATVLCVFLGADQDASRFAS